ncbi:MAG: hypothetical protein IJH37_12190 [Clostridia bacterium]|nr:hypothetical protein [Clostridia bacterium]
MYNDNICGFGYMTGTGSPRSRLVTVSGTSPLIIPNMASNGLRSITIDGNTAQNNPAPTPDNPSPIKAFGEPVTEGAHTGQYRILLYLYGAETVTIPLYLNAPLFKVGRHADRLIVDLNSLSAFVERRIVYCPAPHGIMYGPWAQSRCAFGGIAGDGTNRFFSSDRRYDPGFCTHLKRSSSSSTSSSETDTVLFGTASRILMYFHSRFFDDTLSDYGASELNAWLDENNVMIAYISNTTYDTGLPDSVTDISDIQDFSLPSLSAGNYSLSVTDNSGLEASAVAVTFSAR